MKINKSDNALLIKIFTSLKDSENKLENFITRYNVEGLRISKADKERDEWSKKEFRRLSIILEQLNIAKLKLGSWATEDELYRTPETLKSDIDNVLNNEYEKEQRDDIAAQLNKYNLTYTKYILKTKCLPYLFTIIGLGISTCTYFKEDCTCHKEQKDQIISTTALNKSQKDSIQNNQQTTSVKFLRDTQP